MLGAHTPELVGDSRELLRQDARGELKPRQKQVLVVPDTCTRPRS